MEAPSPITPKPELEEEMKDIKEYHINFLNKNYLVKLGKLNRSQKIGFIIEQTDDIKNFLFESEFSLEDLKQISKLFRIFDSIDEAFNDISDIKIIKAELTEIDINLILTSLISKTENICIQIKKKNLNNEKINEIIFKELNEIKSMLKEEKLKNENLKKTVDELVKENKELKIQVKELIDWKNNLIKKNENNIDNNNLKERIDSNIIKTKEEIELISKRLTSNSFFKNSKVIFNLLYRASRDGDSPYDYHNKCDGTADTLCVIQTIKGCKFGGYKNFFSYNNHKVGTKSQSNYGVMNEDYEINNGEEYFGIKELEVFQIIIE